MGENKNKNWECVVCVGLAGSQEGERERVSWGNNVLCV